jgi:hypothetical protein
MPATGRALGKGRRLIIPRAPLLRLCKKTQGDLIRHIGVILCMRWYAGLFFSATDFLANSYKNKLLTASNFSCDKT